MPPDSDHIYLCAPDESKSCFACCPPIRPPRYEHAQFRSIIKRELALATGSFEPENGAVRPITGYSCWALGYLDKDYKKIGCLLHPARNNGKDLRYRVNYGNKCEREACPQARIFEGLTPACKKFLLGLAGNLDSFSYSSSQNPLFHLLLWGADILEFTCRREKAGAMSLPEFRERYGAVLMELPPKAHSYPITRLSAALGERLLTDPDIRERYLALWSGLGQTWKGQLTSSSDKPFAHNLKLAPLFVDFLKNSLAIYRLTHTEAITLQRLIDSRIDRFGSEVGGTPSFELQPETTRVGAVKP